MIIRTLVQCNSCHEKSIFRFSIGLSRVGQFTCACPNCNIQLRGDFKIDNAPQPNFTANSDNFQTLHGKQELLNDKYPILTLHTELPVHKERHKNSLIEGGSPFLWLSKQMDDFIEFKERVDAIDKIKVSFAPLVKRLTSYAETENWQIIKDEFIKLEIPEICKESTEEQVIYLFYRFLNTTFVPLLEMDKMVEISDEYFVYLNDCLDNKKEKYTLLIKSFVQDHSFNSFKLKVFETHFRAIDNYYAYIPGFAYEYFSSTAQKNINDYRVYRDDFNLIKSLYLDIFELLSRMLFYLGCIVNLSIRNDYRIYSTGMIKSQKFKKMPAYDKMFVLDELPKLKNFINNVQRPLRNDIGHFNVRYNFRKGVLAYDDGTEQNYINFLKFVLDAVRSLWFVIVLTEKIELDLRR